MSHCRAIAVAVLALCCTRQHAAAQLIDRYFAQGIAGYGATPGVTVLSRLHPEYAPPGIRLGDFIINTGMSEALGYDSNVVGLPQAKPSLLQQTEASFLARSDWGRDSVNLGAHVNNRRYPAQPEQSTTNWDTTLGGTYDVGRDQLALGIAHVTASQTPRDLNNPLLTAPANYSVNSAQTSYTANFGRFALVPGVEFGTWRYQNATQGAMPLVLTYQNRNVVTANVVGRYAVAEQRTLLVVLRGVDNRYVAPQIGQPTRNSQGGDLLVGVEYAAGGVWRYRALVGYQTRHYASSAYKTLSEPTAEGNVIWQPTGLTTVTGSVLHTIAESTLTDNTNYTLTQGRVTIDHELRRNILLQARAEVDTATYPQNAGSATLYTAGLSVTWLVNRRVRLVTSYDYSSRRSGASSYTENVALVRLGFGL